jgi:hypothetical protein
MPAVTTPRRAAAATADAPAAAAAAAAAAEPPSSSSPRPAANADALGALRARLPEGARIARFRAEKRAEIVVEEREKPLGASFIVSKPLAPPERKPAARNPRRRATHNRPPIQNQNQNQNQ